MPDFESMYDKYVWVADDVHRKTRELRYGIVDHVVFHDVVQQVLDALQSENADQIIVVMGPARIGKTTLRRSIVGLLEARARRIGENRGSFSFSVPEPNGKGQMNWYLGATRALRDAKEPLIDAKVVYEDITKGAVKRRRPASVEYDERARLGALVTNMREENAPLIIDEVSALPSILSVKQQNRAAHGLKDISEDSGQPIVIIGTGDILNIMELSLQFELRTRLIPFEAYVKEEKSASENRQDSGIPARLNGIRGFRSTLRMTEKILGEEFCVPGALTSHTEEIVTSIDGRSGVLFATVNMLLADSSRRGPITWEMFDLVLAKMVRPSTLERAVAERLEVDEQIAAAKKLLAEAEGRHRHVEAQAATKESAPHIQKDAVDNPLDQSESSKVRDPFKRKIRNDVRESS
ncbi:AAA family ATPase [Burkholderia sp. PU8-34]